MNDRIFVFRNRRTINRRLGIERHRFGWVRRMASVFLG